jgi:hypothetical protein
MNIWIGNRLLQMPQLNIARDKERIRRMEKINLSANELAVRWNVTVKTLRQWRWNGKGPPFFKIGGRAMYRVKDIEGIESAGESKGNKKTTTINNGIDMP